MEADWTLPDSGTDTDSPFFGSFRSVDSQEDARNLIFSLNQVAQTSDLGLINHQGMTSTSPGLDSSYSGVSFQAKKLHVCTLCAAEPPKCFKTVNDLDRHMRSVHKIYEDGVRYWKCGVGGCSSAEECWPRLDNFKAHVTRMHGMQYEPLVGSFCHIFESKSDHSSPALRLKPYRSEPTKNGEETQTGYSAGVTYLAEPIQSTTYYTPPLHGQTSSIPDGLHDPALPAHMLQFDGQVYYHQLCLDQCLDQRGSHVDPQPFSAVNDYSNWTTLPPDEHEYICQQAYDHTLWGG